MTENEKKYREIFRKIHKICRGLSMSGLSNMKLKEELHRLDLICEEFVREIEGEKDGIQK